MNNAHQLFDTVKRVLGCSPAPQWFLPMLVALGVAAGLAESLGISLVILFLYSMLDRASELIASGGLVEAVLRGVISHVGAGVNLAILIFALIAANISLSLIYAAAAGRVRYRLCHSVRNRLNEQYLEVSYDFILSQDQGHLQNVWANESWLMGEAYLYISRVLINICAIIVFAIFLFALSWPLAIVSAGGIIALFSGMHFLWRPVRNLGRRMKLEHDSIADIMLATLQGMRTLRAFGLEPEWRRRFEAASGNVERTSVTFERYYTLVSATIQIGYIFLLVAIVFISNRIEIPFSSTLTFVALLYRLQPNVRELQSNVLAILQLQASISSVVEMLDRADKRYFGTGGEPFGGLRKEIRFEHVSLSYPGAASPSLDRISAVLPAGSVTAIVGPSGAGKTTIVNLLLGLYRQDTGAILVDGVHLDRLSRDSWLARIAVAGQDVDLVEGTVSYNLRLAAPRATLPAMRAAAAIVRMDGVLEGLSQGFDSWIGNRGLKLSGGQRQRLGIARALLREPDILLLDEATSALDRGLESAILSATRDKLSGRTLVIVTHRPEIAMLADQVICMDAGRVVECTSPAELRARPTSFFWALFPEASQGSTVKVH